MIDADATVIFTYGPLSVGSLDTATYAHHLEKPYHVVDLLRTTRWRAVEEIVQWLAREADLNDYDEYVACPPLACILNVAGSRESHAPGIQNAVFCFLVDMLIKANLPSKHFNRLGEARRVKS